MVLDSNVLFGANSTDLLMTLSAFGLFQAHWTQKILDDTERNILLNRREVNRELLQRRFQFMNNALPDALIDVPEGLEKLMTNHIGDRHVLAAAVHIKASVVVTNNLKHFLPADCASFGVEAQNIDDFLTRHVLRSPHFVQEGIESISRRRNSPSQSPFEVVEAMRIFLPGAIELLELQLGTVLDW